MKKNILCIDLDDTIADTAPTILNYAINYDILKLGGNGIIKDVDNNTDCYYFARGLSWDRDKLVSFFQNCYPRYLDDILVLDGANEFSHKVHDMGIEIHIVTARRELDDIVYQKTKDWLAKNKIYYDKLIIDKVNKGNYAKKIGAKYFIDDSIDNCMDVLKTSPNTYVFLINTKYNAGINTNIKRVNNLYEVYEEIKVIEMSNKFIIDGHSHFGIDIFHGITSIDGYIDFALKSGINVGLIMPVPSPCNVLGDIDSRRMWWLYYEDNITHHGINNPFLELNYQLNNLIKEKSSNKLKLFCIPMFHPVLDDVKLFEKMIEEIDPVALKLHGIGSGIGPEDIPPEFIKIIKKNELPLILHTDCDLGANLDRSMIWVRNINTAKNWANFLIRNEIFGTLNHGANLDLETFKLVNETPFIKVALGPSEISCIDSNRLYIDCQGSYKQYLQILRDYLDSSKIIYDADYNWNMDLDYNSVKRVMEIFPDNDLDKILSGNILEHYKKLRKRIR